MFSLSGFAICAISSRIGWSDLRRSLVRLVGSFLDPFAVPFSSRIPVVRQLLDVVHQAVELPLRIDLGSSSQGEAVELLVRPQVAEHRLHGGEAPGDHLAPFIRVDLAFHALGRFLWCFGVLAHEDRHLSDLGPLRVA